MLYKSTIVQGSFCKLHKTTQSDQQHSQKPPQYLCKIKAICYIQSSDTVYILKSNTIIKLNPSVVSNSTVVLFK